MYIVAGGCSDEPPSLPPLSFSIFPQPEKNNEKNIVEMRMQ
jgi:hypothetical protein